MSQLSVSVSVSHKAAIKVLNRITASSMFTRERTHFQVTHEIVLTMSRGIGSAPYGSLFRASHNMAAGFPQSKGLEREREREHSKWKLLPFHNLILKEHPIVLLQPVRSESLNSPCSRGGDCKRECILRGWGHWGLLHRLPATTYFTFLFTSAILIPSKLLFSADQSSNSFLLTRQFKILTIFHYNISPQLKHSFNKTKT